GIPWGQYLGYVAVVGIPLALLLAPFMLIALAKARRRKRRLAAPEAVDRVSGGWREVVDTAVDLGSSVPQSATRRETARDLAEAYPGTRTIAVAERADAAVFGAGEPSEAEVTAFWTEVDRLVSDMSRSVGRWQRLRGRFSLRSLTRGIRPVPTRRGGRP
ncbi:MAG TPA: transglutaminase domain-containing protein, partial [Actinotalea sp.]|nr:transglutaminase domain-containing protein [Actinotalea sp.]